MPQVAGFLMAGFGAAGATAAATLGGGFAIGAAAAAASTSIFGAITAKLLASVATTALMTAIGPGTTRGGGGISISATLHGEASPETLIFGLYATAGHATYVNSHGPSNRFVTYVIELCSAPGCTLSRLMLDDDYVDLGTTLHPDYGQPVLGEDYEGFAWVKFYNGRQTAADPMLVAKYGADPEMPWAASAVGSGICYAILTFRYSARNFNQVPRWLFELKGVPVYDIRKDSTVAGGSGSHRWGNPATWEWSDNPALIAYTIKRGYPLPGGGVWGGRIAADDLRPAIWAQAANACSTQVAIAGGTTERRYRCGLEIGLTSEPAAALAEINKAMSAEVADVGGSWTIRVGAPALASLWIQDADTIVSRPQERDPFPALQETYNAVSAQYPSPEQGWVTRDAAPITNAAAEASDAFGRRTVSLALPAVPYGTQARRLMRAWARADRRFRRHSLTLPGLAAGLEPLDTLDWSSLRNGYVGKDFEIAQITDDLQTGLQQVSILEVDPTDYDPDAEVKDMPPPRKRRLTLPVDGWGLEAMTINGDAGEPRRVALRMVWNPDINADRLQWQVRRVGFATLLKAGAADDLDEGFAVTSAGVLPATAYEARARLVRGGKSRPWSAWASAVTANARLTSADIGDEAVLPSNVAGWDETNLCRDFDCVDPKYWSSGQTFGFVNTNGALLGDRVLDLPARAGQQNVTGLWFKVRPGTEYLLQAGAYLTTGGTGTVRVRVDFAEVDGTGAITNIRSLTAFAVRTDLGYAAEAIQTAVVTSGVSERRARFVVSRDAGGAGNGRAGAFVCRRRVDAKTLAANSTGFNAEVYAAAEAAAGGFNGSPPSSWGAGNISLTVADTDVAGKPITVTFSGEARMTRSTAGYAEGRINVSAGAQVSASYLLRKYIATPNGVWRGPVSVTRRFIAPAVPFSVSAAFTCSPIGSDEHTVTMGMRFRSLTVSVRKDEA